MMDLFKVINGVLNNDTGMFEDPEAQKTYAPFMVNRALSYHQDTLYYANEMNLLWELDKKPQIDFYLNTIRPRKRAFVKWAKKVKEDDLQVVKMYYGYSDRRALEVLKILTDDQITEIKERIYTGE